MHSILVLLRKDFAMFRRNRAAVSLTFIIPFGLIYLFGWVFGINRPDSGPTGIPLAVVNQSADPGAATLVNALKAEKGFKVITERANPGRSSRPLTEADLKPMMKDNVFRFALVIPPDVVSGQRLGLHLKIYSNPRSDVETQMVNGLLQKTIFSHVPQLLGQSLQAVARREVGGASMDAFNTNLAQSIAGTFGGDPDSILKDIRSGGFGLSNGTNAKSAAASTTGKKETTDLLSRIVHIETEQVAGKDVKSPAATRLVGGWAMQFLLFALSASATALFYERDFGIFQRILAGPVTRAQVLWSKFLYGVCLGLLQLLVLFVAGRMLYGIDVEHHLGLLVLTCAVAAAACTSFGMLLAALASSPEAANGMATFLILLMSAIGGAWFPVSFMPEFIQHLSKLTIVYWAMEGFSQVLWANASFTELLPTLGILLGITAAVMSVALWRFNKGKLFE